MQPTISTNFYRNFPERMPTLPPIFAETLADTPGPVKSPMLLFEALIGDPRNLLHDYMERPEAYEHELLPLLLALIAKNKTVENLNPEERELLNQATAIYAAPSSTSRPSANEPPRVSPPPKYDEDDFDDEEEIPWGFAGRANERESIAQDDEEGVPFEEAFPELRSDDGWWRNSF
jgi:hypothetical protein